QQRNGSKDRHDARGTAGRDPSTTDTRAMPSSAASGGPGGALRYRVIFCYNSHDLHRRELLGVAPSDLIFALETLTSSDRAHWFSSTARRRDCRTLAVH